MIKSIEGMPPDVLALGIAFINQDLDVE